MKPMSEDTICGIATASGRSAIGMIRVSGSDAIRICDGIFDGKKCIRDMETFTAAYGHIVNPDTKDPVDEVIVLVMKHPHTYTTEDTVEISTHGGPFVIRRIMDLLLSRGVRPAEPGEFTRRAYMGGRIDMTEAEAVMDVISAESDMALKSSLQQLSGRLRTEITELRDTILHETAFIEAALDDPENYSLDNYDSKLSVIIDEVYDRIEKLLLTYDEGRVLKNGISTVIAGKPNVGKSSILNLLVGQDRAIVSDIEGTTRDTLEEYIHLGSTVLKLVDTAGIRETEDVVEKIGVDRARSSITDADLILYIVDGSEDLSEQDHMVMSQLKGKKVIMLINKSDLDMVVDRDKLMADYKKITGDDSDIPGIYISAKEGTGLEELRSTIEDMFFRGDIDFNNQIYITNTRHKASLLAALDSLTRVKDSIAAGMGEDFYTIDMMAAYESLGEIIGETLEDDLADKIFKDFCMGK